MPRVECLSDEFLPLQGANVGSLVRNENPGCRCACPGLCGTIGLSARPHIGGQSMQGHQDNRPR